MSCKSGVTGSIHCWLRLREFLDTDHKKHKPTQPVLVQQRNTATKNGIFRGYVRVCKPKVMKQLANIQGSLTMTMHDVG